MMEIKKCTEKALLKALWKEAFYDTDDFLEDFFNIAFNENRFNSVFLDNQLAGALYWFDANIEGKKTAYIYAVATKKAYRGKGVASFLIKETFSLLKTKGYEFAILVPSNKELFSFYEKLGFYICGHTESFTVKSSENQIKIEEIGIEEYINLRNLYNAENSLFIANENIEFLKSQLKFYKGKDFVCALTKQEKNLFCKEILGNINASKEIVASLGATFGHFRTIGKSTPFIMGYSLAENSRLYDVYFPFVFD